jgi:glycosyltransferase involved in cell wall biosynthesis
MRKIKLLVVLDSIQAASAMVAALQYKHLFDVSERYEVCFVSYADLHSPAARQLIPGLAWFEAHRLYTHYRNFRLSLRRQQIVRLAANADVVYLVKVPSLELYQSLKSLRRPRILTCFSDGLWLPFFKTWWRDLDEILKCSDGVVCESEFMTGYASNFCPRVFRMHDSPQLEAFDRLRANPRPENRNTILGWIGNSETASNLFKIFEPLELLFSRRKDIHLRIVGADPRFIPRFEAVDWSSATSYKQAEMVREVLQMDIGLFPLFEIQESLARGILKATVYMAGEATVVAQDYGDLRGLIVDGQNGMLAASSEEWVAKLDFLIDNAQERRRMAGNGLDTVRRQFATDVCFGQLCAAIEGVL